MAAGWQRDFQALFGTTSVQLDIGCPVCESTNAYVRYWRPGGRVCGWSAGGIHAKTSNQTSRLRTWSFPLLLTTTDCARISSPSWPGILDVA